MPDGERRLAAIMFTDIAGYTSLAQKDEASTLQALERHRSLLRPLFASHGGREVKTIGDAFLIEFQSALDAVLCGVAVQQMMHDRKVSRGETISLRIGIHVGDVVESGNDILGDAVNIASRIESLTEIGGICISGQVYDQIRNKSDLPFVSLGERTLKNVSSPVVVYAARMRWDQSTPAILTTYPANRIAILPFVSFSSNPDDSYFADGVTDEIISAVAGIRGLSVISRTSVVGYKGTTKRVKEIGRELEVGSILEGTFKKAGNRIRVTTQLIDVAGDRHLWAQSYDRNLDDVFEVQSDIAKQVADSLKVEIISREMDRIEKKPTVNTEAYALYLKGRYLWNRRGFDDLKRAAECFEQAVRSDPNFALGYAGLADCYSLLRVNERVDIDSNLVKAKEMVARALALDPDLAEAHVTKGSLLGQEYDIRGAENEFKRAIELKPGYATAHQWYCFWVLYPEQRWEESLQQIEKAVELDPLSPIITLNHGDLYFNKRDYPKALELYKRGADLDPSFSAANLRLAHTYGMLKMYDEMKREYSVWAEAGRKTHPLAEKQAEAEVAQYLGDVQTIRRLLPEIEANLDETWLSEYGIGCLYFFLGDNDEGFKWLERAYLGKEFNFLWTKSDPDIDPVRTDPRYLDLLKRLGLE